MKRGTLARLILVIAALGFTVALIGQQPSAVDPVCGMTVPSAQAIQARHGDQTYYFCSSHCVDLFAANPGQYIQSANSPAQNPQTAAPPAQMPGCGSRSAVKAAGCGGCPAAAGCAGQAKAQHSCGSGCGQTRAQEINNFHTVLAPMHMSGQTGDIQTVRNTVGSLVDASKSLSQYAVPDGVNAKEFDKARKSLQKSVNNLSKSCKKGPDERVLADLNTVHERYVALQTLVQ